MRSNGHYTISMRKGGASLVTEEPMEDSDDEVIEISDSEEEDSDEETIEISDSEELKPESSSTLGPGLCSFS